jgi:hypothetical protein
MEINKFSEFDEQRTPFADYIKILSDNGDNFDIDDIKLSLNSIEREQDGAIITAYHRGQPTK